LIFKTFPETKARSLVEWLGQKAHVHNVLEFKTYWMDVSEPSNYIYNNKEYRLANKAHQKIF
jgi:hypothetical protein